MVSGQEAVVEFPQRVPDGIVQSHQELKGFTEWKWLVTPSRGSSSHPRGSSRPVSHWEIPSLAGGIVQSHQEVVGEIPLRVAGWIPTSGGNGFLTRGYPDT